MPGCLIDSLAKGQQLPLLLEQLRFIKPNSVTLAAALGACGLQGVEGEGTVLVGWLVGWLVVWTWGLDFFCGFKFVHIRIL